MRNYRLMISKKIRIFSIAILIIVIVYACAARKPVETPKFEYYTPIHVEPLSQKLSIAIPIIENVDLKHPENLEISSILRELRTSIINGLNFPERFEILDLKDIKDFYDRQPELNPKYAETLESVDLILYLLITNIDTEKFEVQCGYYFITNGNRDVLLRAIKKFTYAILNNKFVFDDKQIFKFALDLSRKFPKLTGSVALRNDNSIKIELANYDKVFVDQRAIIVTKISKKDPKYATYGMSNLPIAEAKITKIEQGQLIAEITSGGENPIKPGDVVIFK
jgi:hypothetical protein